MFDVYDFIERIEGDLKVTSDSMQYYAGEVSAYRDTLDYIAKNAIFEYDDVMKFFRKKHKQFHESVDPNFIKGYYSGLEDTLNTLLTYNKKEDE